MKLNSQEIIQKLIAKKKKEINELEKGLERIKKAVQEAPGAMQSRHDTTKKEQGLLHVNLSKQLNEIRREISMLQNAIRQNRINTDSISIGHIIEVKFNGNEKEAFLIVPGGSGNEINIENIMITCISPNVPLAQALMGKRKGDNITLGALTANIKSIQ